MSEVVRLSSDGRFLSERSLKRLALGRPKLVSAEVETHTMKGHMFATRVLAMAEVLLDGALLEVLVDMATGSVYSTTGACWSSFCRRLVPDTICRLPSSYKFSRDRSMPNTELKKICFRSSSAKKSGQDLATGAAPSEQLLLGSIPIFLEESLPEGGAFEAA